MQLRNTASIQTKPILCPSKKECSEVAIETIKVPDIGGAENVDVIEVSVAVGDMVKAEDSLIVLESDKASMDIPAPKSGKVVKILLKEGDQVSEGAAIIELETEATAEADTKAE